MLWAVKSPVFASTSAKTTSAPSSLAALAVAKKVIGEVKIILPLFIPREEAIDRWDRLLKELAGIVTYRLMGYI